MKIRHLTLLLLLASAVFTSSAMADTFPPNSNTPLGPGFHLDTSHATGPLGLIDPCWFIGITGSTLPAVQNIDLSDATHPVLSSILSAPDPTDTQDFQLYLGWVDPAHPSTEFSFDVPSGMPRQNPDGTYDIAFTASTLGTTTGPTFTGLFHLDVGDGSVTRWDVITPPDPAYGSAFEIDFSVTPGGSPTVPSDPDLTFSSTQSFDGATVPLSFTLAPTPEPTSSLLLGIGLIGLFRKRPRSR